MKEDSTLNLLTRQVELRLKEAQVQISKIEKILSQRLIAENQLLNEIEKLNARIKEEKKMDRQRFLAGSKNNQCDLEDFIVLELDKIKTKLQLVINDRVSAEQRLRIAQNELMVIQKEKEGLLKVVDAKLIEEERIRIEKSESN